MTFSEEMNSCFIKEKKNRIPNSMNIATPTVSSNFAAANLKTQDAT